MEAEEQLEVNKKRKHRRTVLESSNEESTTDCRKPPAKRGTATAERARLNEERAKIEDEEMQLALELSMMEQAPSVQTQSTIV